MCAQGIPDGGGVNEVKFLQSFMNTTIATLLFTNNQDGLIHTIVHEQVWVGTVDDLLADGSVKDSAAYPTSYANTIRNEWGYRTYYLSAILDHLQC